MKHEKDGTVIFEDLADMIICLANKMRFKNSLNSIIRFDDSFANPFRINNQPLLFDLEKFTGWTEISKHD